MSGHPFKKFRQSNVSRARAGDLTSAYSGSEIGDESPMARIRADRPMRASGGGVKGKGVTVNVITGGQQQPPPEPPVMMPPPPPPGPPPGAPPMAGPPMPPGGPGGPMGPGGPPPGMPMRAKGGGVKSKGMKVGTKVQHLPGQNDIKDIHRPRQVTFATGGGVQVSFKANMGPKMHGGAGGGKGRLEKAEDY